MYAEKSELGKKTQYASHYDPSLLFPIERKMRRNEIGIHKENTLPFSGFDLWNHYEVSWLNTKGKPVVAIAKIIYACDSKYIIESKSMKLYFNSFNNTKFDTTESLQNIIKKDLFERLHTSFLDVTITPLNIYKDETLSTGMQGICLDSLDIECEQYNAQPELLTTENESTEETLYSDLLKSNCLVTNQPDWCSIQISYKGKKINHEGLLRYLVSFRNDNEFHEQCIEKIFMQILNHCKPETLTVYGRSTRRGGIDINSYRSTSNIHPDDFQNIRLCRQ